MPMLKCLCIPFYQFPIFFSFFTSLSPIFNSPFLYLYHYILNAFEKENLVMGVEKQKGKVVLALVLFSVLMLPMAIRFSHLWESHEHPICTVETDHFHKAASDCLKCHFQPISFIHYFPAFPELLSVTLPETLESHFFCLVFRSLEQTNTQLRAPPILS